MIEKLKALWREAVYTWQAILTTPRPKGRGFFVHGLHTGVPSARRASPRAAMFFAALTSRSLIEPQLQAHCLTPSPLKPFGPSMLAQLLKQSNLRPAAALHLCNNRIVKVIYTFALAKFNYVVPACRTENCAVSVYKSFLAIRQL